MHLAPCIEWMFAEDHADMGDRIRAVKAAGFDAAEFHLWRDKDLDSIATALAETGVDYQVIATNTKEQAHLTDAYRAINPRQQVPALMRSKLRAGRPVASAGAVT